MAKPQNNRSLEVCQGTDGRVTQHLRFADGDVTLCQIPVESLCRWLSVPVWLNSRDRCEKCLKRHKSLVRSKTVAVYQPVGGGE